MIRPIVLAVMTIAGTAGAALAQAPTPAGPPQGLGGIPLVLGEHGDERLAIPPFVGLAGLVVYDILTASGSAQTHNVLHPEDPVSTRTAFVLSLASTAVPALAGATLMQGPSPPLGILLLSGGVVVGPSVGHWYSGRLGRGLLTAGLRAGVGLLFLVAAVSAS